MYYNNVSESLNQHDLQLDKENYIVNMLVRTLYSNDINNAECYRIIKMFKDKILGDTIL